MTNTDGAAQGEAVWEIHCNKCKTGKFTSWRSWHDNHGPYWMCTECDNYVFAAGLVPLLGAALIDDHRKAQTADVLVKALEHSIWMNRWQFDEHRTGGHGELKDDGFCRCDWCKTYRDCREEDGAALAQFRQEFPDA